MFKKILIIYLFITPSLGYANSCKYLFLFDNMNFSAPSSVMTFLSGSTKKLITDIEPKNYTPNQKELRRLILNSNSTEFNALWSTVSKKNLLLISELIKTNQIQANEHQKELMQSLEEFVRNDETNSLWPKHGNSWSKLITTYKEFQGSTHMKKAGGTLAGIDTYMLVEVQKQIIKSALGKESTVKKGPWWQRLVGHPYKHVLKILDFNNQYIEYLTYIDSIKSSLDNILKQEQNPKIYQQFKKLYRELEIERAQAVHRIEEVYYGKQTNTKGVFINQNFSIYKLSRSIKQKKLDQVHNKIKELEDIENTVLAADKIINNARKTNGQKVRTEKDMDSTELQVRNRRFLRHSKQMREEWDSIMNQHTPLSVNVEYSYTVMVPKQITTHSKDGPKTTTTMVPETRYSSERVSVTYKDVLTDSRMSRFTPGSSMSFSLRSGNIVSVSGKQEVLSQTESAYRKESNIYGVKNFLLETTKQIVSHSNKMYKIRNSQSELNQLLNTEQQQLTELLNKKRIVEEQLSESELSVHSYWAKDNFNHYKSRHNTMLESLKSAIEVQEAFIEQIRRKELDIHIKTFLADHSKELNQLKWRYLGKNTALFTIGTGFTGSFAAYFLHPEFQSYINSLWLNIQSLF